MKKTSSPLSDDPDWWRNAIIYQIYPRSFQDSNNDGIGDLQGITQRLDYIAELGVDGIWISPFFTSPMKDFGYDVADYRSVDPIFGTLADFKILLARAHSLGLRVIIDLVLSHTSDAHPWFTQSRKNNNNEKASWYVWADAKISMNGARLPPNNWVSVFGGSAWEWDDARGQYYLHNFLKEQPDLNFHNPQVQDEMLDICRFWLDLGVDGFRLDVVNFYFHDPLLRDNPARTEGTQYATQLESDVPYSRQQHIYDKSRLENLEFIKKIRNLVDQYPNRMIVGEIGDDHPYERAQEYTRGPKMLHTCYNTHMMSGVQKQLTEDLIRIPIETFFNQPDTDESLKSWPSWAFSNHDVVRASSRWFGQYTHNPQFSKLLIALLGCLPGTLFLYQGEELGLPEAEIPFDALRDPWAKETWPLWQGRDGCRTPMPWAEGQFCRFTETTAPWLPIPDAHHPLNIIAQSNNKDSVLAFTRRFITWRNTHIKPYKNRVFFYGATNCNTIKISIKNEKYETICLFNLSPILQEINGESIDPYGIKIDGFNE